MERKQLEQHRSIRQLTRNSISAMAANVIHTLSVPKEEYNYSSDRHEEIIQVTVDGSTANNSFTDELNYDVNGETGWVTVIRNMNSIRVIVEANYTTSDRYATIDLTHNDDASVVEFISIKQVKREYGITLSSYEVELTQFPGNGDGTECEKRHITVNMTGEGKDTFRVSKVREFYDGQEIIYDHGLNFESADNYKTDLTILNYGQPFVNTGTYYIVTLTNPNDKAKTADIKVTYSQTVATMMASTSSEQWAYSISAYDLEDSFAPLVSTVLVPYYGGNEDLKVNMGVTNGLGWRMEGTLPEWVTARERISDVIFDFPSMNTQMEDRTKRLKLVSLDNPNDFQYIDLIQEGYKDLKIEFVENDKHMIKFYPTGNTMNTQSFPARKSVNVKVYGGKERKFSILMKGKEVKFNNSFASFANGNIKISVQLVEVGSLYNEYEIMVVCNKEVVETKELEFKLVHLDDKTIQEDFYVTELGKASMSPFLKVGYDLDQRFPSDGIIIKDIQITNRYCIYNGDEEEIYENSPVWITDVRPWIKVTVHDNNLMDIEIDQNKSALKRGSAFRVTNSEFPRQTMLFSIIQDGTIQKG